MAIESGLFLGLASIYAKGLAVVLSQGSPQESWASLAFNPYLWLTFLGNVLPGGWGRRSARPVQIRLNAALGYSEMARSGPLETLRVKAVMREPPMIISPEATVRRPRG
jgi:hypothetical protein